MGSSSGSVSLIVDDRGSRSLYRVATDRNTLQPVVNDPGSVASFAVGATGRLAYEFASPKGPAEVFFRAGAESARN